VESGGRREKMTVRELSDVDEEGLDRDGVSGAQ
jgi:hypothetical protein